MLRKMKGLGLIAFSILGILSIIASGGGEGSSGGSSGGSNGLGNGLGSVSFDTTFGANGVVIHGNAAGGNGLDRGWSIILDSNDKILVTGQSSNGTDDDMVIWRYNDDGTPDATFGANGVIVDDNAAGGNSSDAGYSIILDSNSKILVTGQSGNGTDEDMVIWRYNDDGTPDTTFGINGVVVHDNAAGGNGLDNGFSIISDSNGKILVTGWSHNGTDYDMVIWRYNDDGTLDTTFGANGKVVHDNAAGGNNGDKGFSIILDNNGRILVTGQSSNATDEDMAIWRYNDDGTPDTTFGINGVVVHDNAAGGNGQDNGFSIISDSNGKILITGWSHNGTDDDMVIWRYNDDGTPDTTFGANGLVVHDNAAGGNGQDNSFSSVLDSNDRIFVTGWSHNGTNYDMVIWCYNDDGTPDTTFGANGVVVHNNAAGGNNSDAAGYSIILDSNGKILVAGQNSNGIDEDIVIYRFIP